MGRRDIEGMSVQELKGFGNSLPESPGDVISGTAMRDDAGLGLDSVSSSSTFPNGWQMGLLVGAIVGGSVLIIVLIIVIMRRCGAHRQKLLDLDFEDVRSYTSKSAPSTRNSSPQLLKRGSASSSSSQKAMFIKSLTVDMIPDFELPPERVQPHGAGDKRGSTTSLQYQHSLLNTLQADYSSGSSRGSSIDEESGEGLPSPAGRLWFSLIYDAAVEELTVNLIKAKYLKPRDKTNASRDPFVKLYLLPDERTCQESRVRKNTLAPKFNETFTFKIAESDVASKTLRLSVYDVDKRRVRHSLGHVIIVLRDLDLTRGDIMWRDLEAMSQSNTSLGEINLSLGYTPTTEKLKVVVLRARNLRKLEYDEAAMYIRVQLMHGTKVHKTKKTTPQRGTCEPVYNESFSFTVPTKQIDSCSVVVTVVVSSMGRVGRHEEEYAKTTVGPFMYARGEELMHWQEVMAQPRNMVSRWHHLTTGPKVGHTS